MTAREEAVRRGSTSGVRGCEGGEAARRGGESEGMHARPTGGWVSDGMRGCRGGEAARRRGEGEERRCGVRARMGEAARRRDGGVGE